MPLAREENTSNLKQQCKLCQNEFPLSQLRRHLKECAFARYDSEDEFLEYSVFDSIITSPPTTTSIMATTSSTTPIIPITSNATSLIENVPTTTSIMATSSSTNPIMVTVSNTTSIMASVNTASTSSTTSITGTTSSVTTSEFDASTVNTSQTLLVIDSDNDDIPSLSPHELIEKDINHMAVENNPKEIWRIVQKHLVKGRPLEVEDETTCTNGQTNLIMVNCLKLISSGLEEISYLENLSLTLEVQFYGEVCCSL